MPLSAVQFYSCERWYVGVVGGDFVVISHLCFFVKHEMLSCFHCNYLRLQ